MEGNVVWSSFLSGLETLRMMSANALQHTGFHKAWCGLVVLGFFRGGDVSASVSGPGSVSEEMAARSAQMGTSLFSG